ncbi:MAG TPA: hypothetical protein VKE22_11595, partial [Haliangiales bacterium]|nr:hypothetical protein [Haliangiales bacterium]
LPPVRVPEPVPAAPGQAIADRTAEAKGGAITRSWRIARRFSNTCGDWSRAAGRRETGEIGGADLPAAEEEGAAAAPQAATKADPGNLADGMMKQ